MTMRGATPAATLAIAVALLIAAAVWLVGTSPQDRENPSIRPPSVPPPEVVSPTIPVETRTTHKVEVVEPTAEVPSVPAGEDGLTPLTIEVIVVDHQGVAHDAEDGLLYVTFAGDSEGKRVARWDSQRENTNNALGEISYISLGGSFVPIEALEVSAGRTHVRVLPGAYIRAAGCSAGGRATRSTSIDSWTSLAGLTTLRVIASWPPPITLDVRDRESGARLSDVDVLVPGEGQYTPHHTAPAKVLVEHAASPIGVPQLFPGPGRQSILFVHASGYAARSIRVYPNTGGETLVTLAGGGDVEVFIDGDLADAAAEVRVRDPANRRRVLVARAPVDEQRHVRFDGLTTGPLMVRVEVGEYWKQSRRVLGEASVNVERGQLSTVRVRVEPVPIVSKAPLRGVVQIPDSWDVRSYSLNLALDSPPLIADAEREMRVSLSRRAVGSDEWVFDAGMVQPGTYLVRVEPVYFGATVEVPPGGNTDARIDVAPPATLLVRALDHTTGAPVDGSHLDVLWNLALARSVRSKWAGSYDAQLLGRRVTAPATRIQVKVRCDGYRDQWHTVNLTPGENPDLEVRLRKVSRVMLRFLDRGEAMASSSFDAWLVPLDGQGGCGMSTQGMRGSFDNAELGRYELTVEPHPDYRPIATREVVVKEGEVGEVTIELERLW